MIFIVFREREAVTRSLNWVGLLCLSSFDRFVLPILQITVGGPGHMGHFGM